MKLWYVVECIARQERKAVAALLAEGYQHTLLPMCKSWEYKRSWEEQPWFPRYLFVNCEQYGRKPGRDTRNGIVGLLRFGDSLGIVSDEVIAAIRARLKEEGGCIVLNRRAYYRNGQKLAISDGPFAGHEGLFVRSAQHRSAALLDLIGKSMRVRIPVEAVRAVS